MKKGTERAAKQHQVPLQPGQAKALIQPSSAKCPGLGAAKGKRLQPRRPGWGLLVLPVGWGMPRTLLIPRDLLWVQAVRAGGPWWLQSLSPQRQREPRPEWPLAPCPEFGMLELPLWLCAELWLQGTVRPRWLFAGLDEFYLQPAIPWGIPAGTASQCLLEPGSSPAELLFNARFARKQSRFQVCSAGWGQGQVDIPQALLFITLLPQPRWCPWGDLSEFPGIRPILRPGPGSRGCVRPGEGGGRMRSRPGARQPLSTGEDVSPAGKPLSLRSLGGGPGEFFSPRKGMHVRLRSRGQPFPRAHPTGAVGHSSRAQLLHPLAIGSPSRAGSLSVAPASSRPAFPAQLGLPREPREHSWREAGAAEGSVQLRTRKAAPT
ncbi:uncharacterized protein LOC127461539 [Manacus candei]|uniref:uncharacterized protein LOC127461539 n=1 Tax=Manacus candei TaxID=415023 RepID=UPI002226FA2C|nr:uncharacterized protein LOC127461539 [Manacus candei]